MQIQVNPDKRAEYTGRHSLIWPELHKMLKSRDVHNGSVFLLNK
jgi:L-rhamnose mutarotase